MFELLEIHRNKDIWQRIFPVVLADAKIYDEIDRIDYLNFWDDKIQQLKDKIKTIQNPVGIGQVIEKVNQYEDIRRVNDELMDMLRNMNTLTPDMHKSSQFTELLQAVEKFAQENNDSLDKNNPSSTSDSTNATTAKSVIDDIQSERNKSITKRLEMLNKLLSDYEDKLMLEDDPKKTMLFEKEIEKLKQQIEAAKGEMK
ncbi:MAG: hypothetical protein HC831_07560 [Chloroflexia bacterium]|nr:hypothetical protein [Chloroflexia bacterium]